MVGEEIKRHLLEVEEAEAGATMKIASYDRPLTSVSSFKYLGWVLTAAEDNWTAVIRNLQGARKKWEQLSQVPGR